VRKSLIKLKDGLVSCAEKGLTHAAAATVTNCNAAFRHRDGQAVKFKEEPKKINMELRENEALHSSTLGRAY